MKKVSVLAVLALMPVCGAIAGPGMKNNNMNNNNTMNNNQPTYWSVMEVMSLPDNAPVAMRGRITQNMGDSVYIFEDSSGTIMMEIDEEDWNGNTVRVNDIVTVYGNVDKGDNYLEIDVNSVEK
ncbi:MAG: NirD/YgiW/YdeI family stress tolerance protein [Alphaproteobacteria bacterium]|nr:NirD/YgiW/YdeI family stress tolerance protein [Alphaproteobacteria bacterium]